MIDDTNNLNVSRLSQIVLVGVEEITGRPGVRAVLNAAELSNLVQSSNIGNPAVGESPFNELSAIELALEEMYGKRGGRGIANQIKRARVCFPGRFLARILYLGQRRKNGSFSGKGMPGDGKYCLCDQDSAETVRIVKDH